MNPKKLIINYKTLTYEDILTKKYQSQNFSAYEKHTLDFCSEWLSNQQAFKVQTSGSTGKPKLLNLLRRQMQASAKMTAKALKLRAGDKALCCINTDYIGGKMMLVRSFVLGLDLEIITPKSNPFLSKKTYDRYDFIALVPLQLEHILEANQGIEWLNKSENIIIGGAAVSYVLEKKIQDLQAAVYSTFGMTETVSHIAMKRLNGKEKTKYYKTLEGVEISQDKRKCLLIKSPSTLGKSLITNDLVSIIDNNTFEYLGRIDNVINSGAYKIQVEKIEQLLTAVFDKFGAEVSFFVAGLPDEKLGQRACIIVEGQPLEKSLERKVLEALSRSVRTKFEVPKAFIYKKNFVRTATGKIKRRESLSMIT